MMSVRMFIIDNALEDTDPDEIAAKYLSQFSTIEDLRAAAFPSVAKEAAVRLRELVRAVERQADLRAGPTSRLELSDMDAEGNDPRRRIADLLHQRCFVPDKGRLLWSEMTVADHEARIAFLEQFVRSVRSTITMHKQAVKLLTDADVESLGAMFSEGTGA